MARWRHAVELAMTDEAIGKLTEISRSRTVVSNAIYLRETFPPGVGDHWILKNNPVQSSRNLSYFQ